MARYAELSVDDLTVSRIMGNDGVALLGGQQAAIADASVAHALNATFSDTEAEAALNALGTKVNAIIAALRAHGIIAT